MKLDAPWLNAPEVRTLFGVFSQAGFELRFVGGCVRDTIMGREVREMDAATDATPDQAMALLARAGIRTIPTGIAHGTVTALAGGRPFEITTLRNDIATDGRWAEVAFTTRWEEDAKRRDFTMNALYVDAGGTVYDYADGLKDCKTRDVRFIGDPAQRIAEDRLRILRYFRFVATVGDNRFDGAALAACRAGAEGIAQLSGERIAQELLKLLAADDPSFALEKMWEAGVLQAALPFLTSPPRTLAGGHALLGLAALIGDKSRIASAAGRLRLSGKQVRSLETWLAAYPSIAPGMNALAQQKLVRRLGGDDYLLSLRLACALSDKSWEDYAPLAGMAAWQPPLFPVTAKDLMSQGFTEGKALGDRLKELEMQWEESGYALAKDELLSATR